jgi:hypothetical protein
MRTQEEKGIRWMPWHKEAKKDVLICEKLWLADKERLPGGIRMGKPSPLGLSYNCKVIRGET